MKRFHHILLFVVLSLVVYVAVLAGRDNWIELAIFLILAGGIVVLAMYCGKAIYSFCAHLLKSHH